MFKMVIMAIVIIRQWLPTCSIVFYIVIKTLVLKCLKVNSLGAMGSINLLMWLPTSFTT